MNTRKLLVSVLMLVSILLSACAPATTPPVPTAIPPTALPSTAVPTLASDQALTTFSPKAFKLPMSVSLGSQWNVAEDYPDVVSLVSNDYYVDLAFILVKDIKLADPKNSFEQAAFPDDFVTWIQEHGLFPVVETQPVVVAGFQGIEINSIVTSDCGDRKNWLFYSSNAWNCRTGEYYHFIYLEDVHGERVLIMNTGGSASEKDFNLGVEAAQKVLDTVVFSEPTAFSSDKFQLPMSVSFSSDWHVVDDFADLVTVADKQKDWSAAFNIVTNAKVAHPVSGAQIPFPEDFASWIKSNPDFKADEPTEVTVAGVQGLQIDAMPIPTKVKGFLYLSGTNWNLVPSPEHWRFILLNNINGERLLIFLIAPADQFKEAVEQSQKVLDTVVFAKQYYAK